MSSKPTPDPGAPAPTPAAEADPPRTTTRTTPQPETPPRHVAEPSDQIRWPAVVGRWHEDNRNRTKGVRRMVPTSVDLGPSRFRWTIELAADGRFETNVIGRTDRHRRAHGTWTREGDVIVATYEDQGETLIRRFEVLELSDGLLRLLPQPSA